MVWEDSLGEKGTGELPLGASAAVREVEVAASNSFKHEAFELFTRIIQTRHITLFAVPRSHVFTDNISCPPLGSQALTLARFRQHAEARRAPPIPKDAPLLGDVSASSISRFLRRHPSSTRSPSLRLTSSLRGRLEPTSLGMQLVWKLRAGAGSEHDGSSCDRWRLETWG